MCPCGKHVGNKCFVDCCFTHIILNVARVKLFKKRKKTLVALSPCRLFTRHHTTREKPKKQDTSRIRALFLFCVPYGPGSAGFHNGVEVASKNLLNIAP